MNKVVRSVFLFSLIFCLVGMVVAQPNAVIVVKGVTTQTIKDAPMYGTTISSGLPNVGKGQNVWLQAQATRGAVPTTIHFDTLVSVTWRVITAPNGSTATIHAIDTANGLKGFTAVLVPDFKGQYQIGLTVVTANGTSAEVTQYINAGTWVGMGPNVNDAVIPQCGFCHTEKFDSYAQTNHATAFQRKIDDTTGHFGSGCVSCHTVGYDKTSTAVNGGFDDLATTLGWIFPAIKPTNWDSMQVLYPTLANLAGIQCENCHGPGSQHAGQLSKNQIAKSLSVDVCAQCHDAPPHHANVAEWKTALHSNSVAEGTNYQYMNRDPCAQCHTAQGFIDKTVEGGTLAVPYTDPQPITCAACHDPHDASHPGQLRKAALADACVGCHTTRMSSRGLHTSPQGPMLAGSTGTPFDGNFAPAANGNMIGNIGGWQLAGYQYPNSAHTTITDKCVVCHMAAAPADAKYNLPANTLYTKLGGHTFKVFWDGGTADSVSTADDIVNPTGCVDCHQHINGDVTATYVRNSQKEIQVLLDTLKALLPKTNGTPKSFTDNTLSVIQRAGSYNWNFVTNDASVGVHNHAYAKALLNACIDQLRLTTGAATISSIQDVPNDQGKLVQIIWNQFPSEKYSINPVTSYGVWRQDGASLGKNGAVQVTSLREMFANAAPNTRFSLNGAVWTFVGSVPATKLAQYSYDAPTVFDSTVVKGMYKTTFYVCGYTSNSSVVYSAPADSGYSVDNLAPTAPNGFGVANAAQGVKLSWNPAPDADVNYYAIYRSISQNFDIAGMAPLATTTVNQYNDINVANGNTYYYKVVAFDFSGNQGTASKEAGLLAEGVSNAMAMPTEFALQQNYPNPFNPSTEIKYQLPQAGHVKITVYNTIGAEVVTLVDQDQSSGYYTARWNGKDRSGNTVSSGIYLYKMQAGSFSATQKMILMK